jgi:serine/threonine protein kinase
MSEETARLGKYELLRRIAVGGMAEIWVARVAGDLGVQKFCVVKRILPHLVSNPEFLRMFTSEARLAATLNHANLVQLHDVGEIGGSPFIAMEYLHGEDVRTVKKAVRQKGGAVLPLGHALNICASVASGLHYMHTKVGLDGKPLNIVHRDVSPHNVFVTYDGNVKLLDFGIAKSEKSDNQTKAGTLKGKIRYMAPEQCMGEQVDARCDIYSVGVMLFELTTGKRLSPPGASEYEMMRSIIEGDVPAPTRFIKGYPPALEQIVMKCLAKRRDKRYATARDLQAALEELAREDRLPVSSLALSSFMSELFGRRVEAWREALAGSRDLFSHIVEHQERREPEAQLVEIDDNEDAIAPILPAAGRRAYGAQLEVRTGGATEVIAEQRSSNPAFLEVPAPQPSRPNAAAAPADKAPASAANSAANSASIGVAVTRKKTGSLSVVALTGRLTEGFNGRALASDLSGRVVLDLAGIQRVTSFGVREWLQMMDAIGATVSELWLARCSEPVVNQLAMIRRFAGHGRVASFLAAYRCGACGAAFTRTFDTELDAELIRAGKAPPHTCPKCDAQGDLDDDASTYFAFATPFLTGAMPADVRAALHEISRADAAAETIEKVVEDAATRVRVSCALDGQVRWKRVLDGIEGKLILDLGAVPKTTSEGATALERALRSLGDEVTETQIEACPADLVPTLTSVKPPLHATIVSVTLEGKCAACGVPREAQVTVKDILAARSEHRAPYGVCKRCNGQLDFSGARDVIRALDGSESTAGSGVMVHSPSAPQPPVSVAVAPKRSLVVPAALGAVALIGAVAFFALRNNSKPEAVAAPTATVSATPAPAWTQRTFGVDAGVATIVGRGEGATREIAESAAHGEAYDELLRQMLADLAGSELYGFVKSKTGELPAGPARLAALEAESARYAKMFGASATPKQVDSFARRQGSDFVVFVRLELSQDALSRAVKVASATATSKGATFARAFPMLARTLKPEADIVVVSVQQGSVAGSAGLREGDVVVRIDGAPAASIDLIAQTLDHGAATLDVETGGAVRSVRVDAKKP